MILLLLLLLLLIIIIIIIILIIMIIVLIIVNIIIIMIIVIIIMIVIIMNTLPVPVKNTLLLPEPWPSNPTAETALQPIIWCSESLSSRGSSSPEECFLYRHW